MNYNLPDTVKINSNRINIQVRIYQNFEFLERFDLKEASESLSLALNIGEVHKHSRVFFRLTLS